MSQEPFQQYQTQQIMTASPARLVFLLYDRAIGSLREAIKAIEAGDIEARWRANKRAMDIIEHMQITLNHEQGGEIAANLEQLFALLSRELPRIDRANDARIAEKAIGLLQPLRDSWRQLADQGEQATQLAAQQARKAVTPPPSTRPQPRQTPPAPAEGGARGLRISA